MTYNIVLGNPFKMKYRWQELCDETIKLFKPSVKKGNKIRVFSTMTNPGVLPTDAIVYVIPNQDFSLVARHFGMWDEARELGVTYPGRPSACEVYRDTEIEGEHMPPSMLAKVIWHEVGHNKAQMGIRAFHRQDGLRVDRLTRHDQLTKSNSSFMATYLVKDVPQWTGGFFE